tara:strand:- start:444 stop:1418 length:975 start_codon:yes stop_codon:yes gene_type:complete
MEFSVGKAIRSINKEGLKSAYFLRGDDFYLQNFFTKFVNKKFDSSVKVKHIDLSDNNDVELLFNDLSSMSLFSSKNIFSIRNFSKLSKNNKDHLLSYFLNPSDDNVLIFILDDFLLKNKFLKDLHSKCIKVDTNTPFFNNKIRDWVKYYMQINKINLDSYVIDDLINSYGDNIANVINEIEKLFLITRKRDIKIDDYKSSYKNRNLKVWNLMDSIGKKDLYTSINVFDSLIINGISVIPIVSNLFAFYFMILNSHDNISVNDYRINKTIQSKVKVYKSQYNESEILNIIIELRNIDVLSKTTSLDTKLLFHPFIVKICKGYYGL